MVAYRPFRYNVYALNNETGKGDSLEYFVQVESDAWPRMQIEELTDSVLVSYLFFMGVIQDDYGFSSLQFSHRIFKQTPHRAGEEAKFISQSLPF